METKEFNLIEERKKLHKDILKHFKKWEGTIEDKFDRYFNCIKEQDEEFIKKLKNVDEDIIIERGQFNRSYFKAFIDKLVGDEKNGI